MTDLIQQARDMADDILESADMASHIECRREDLLSWGSMIQRLVDALAGKQKVDECEIGY